MFRFYDCGLLREGNEEIKINDKTTDDHWKWITAVLRFVSSNKSYIMCINIVFYYCQLTKYWRWFMSFKLSFYVCLLFIEVMELGDFFLPANKKFNDHQFQYSLICVAFHMPTHAHTNLFQSGEPDLINLLTKCVGAHEKSVQIYNFPWFFCVCTTIFAICCYY